MDELNNEEMEQLKELTRRLSYPQVEKAAKYIRARGNAISQEKSFYFEIGQEVSFGKLNGVEQKGKIIKLNPKKAKILENGTRKTWKCPYSLITPLPPKA